MMFDQQDAEIEMSADSSQQLREFIDLAVIQPARGFVEQQQLRPADQRAGQFHPLLRAERQAAGKRVGDLVQLQQIQQVVQSLARELILTPHNGQAQRIGDETGTA